MSPDSVFWFGRAWYTLLAISVKVRESLVQFPGDCTFTFSLIRVLSYQISLPLSLVPLYRDSMLTFIFYYFLHSIRELDVRI